MPVVSVDPLPPTLSHLALRGWRLWAGIWQVVQAHRLGGSASQGIVGGRCRQEEAPARGWGLGGALVGGQKTRTGRDRRWVMPYSVILSTSSPVGCGVARD